MKFAVVLALTTIAAGGAIAQSVDSTPFQTSGVTIDSGLQTNAPSGGSGAGLLLIDSASATSSTN